VFVSVSQKDERKDNPAIYVQRREIHVSFSSQATRIIVPALEPYQIRKTRYKGNVYPRVSVAVARASTELCGSCRGEHSSASCSKTRTRMEAEFEVRPSRVRSSHKLASCRGRQHSWTVPIWILEAWTRANLAQPHGKCRERATAPIPLPGVEACGPILSFGLFDILSFVPSRALTCPDAMKSRKVLREFASVSAMSNYVLDNVRDVSR